eukprot:Pgem_evm1s13854
MQFSTVLLGLSMFMAFEITLANPSSVSVTDEMAAGFISFSAPFVKQHLSEKRQSIITATSNINNVNVNMKKPRRSDDDDEEISQMSVCKNLPCGGNSYHNVPRHFVNDVDLSFGFCGAYAEQKCMDFKSYDTRDEAAQREWKQCQYWELVSCFRNSVWTVYGEVNGDYESETKLFVKESISYCAKKSGMEDEDIDILNTDLDKVDQAITQDNYAAYVENAKCCDQYSFYMIGAEEENYSMTAYQFGVVKMDTNAPSVCLSYMDTTSSLLNGGELYEDKFLFWEARAKSSHLYTSWAGAKLRMNTQRMDSLREQMLDALNNNADDLF